MKFGMVGLGKMGANLAVQATEKGLSAVGTDTRPKPELENIGVTVTSDTASAGTPSGRTKRSRESAKSRK